MNPSSPGKPDLDTLVSLFYPSRDRLGRFVEVSAEEMPEPYRGLLAHEHHMTVTVEAHYGCPVDVLVLDKVSTPTHYAREILLTRQSDSQVVQYGIMRVGWAYFEDEIRQAIESADVPLGRILIEHDVFRRIHVEALWKIEPGPELCRYLGLNGDETTYGRTALIYCDEKPAVELLEIVMPE